LTASFRRRGRSCLTGFAAERQVGALLDGERALHAGLAVPCD
jgi:hypothetical protein